jgi:MFS family permease
MNPRATDPSTASSDKGKWMVLIAAFLGWMFDGFEMGLFPLIGNPALTELLGPSAPKGDADKWFGGIIAVFLVGAATGGVLFGWLGDRFGRVRAMSLSIFTYAIFTGACGFATEAWHIAVLRFIASLGMGGEWSLGVALVNEIWPGKSRAITAGLIGAAANVGFLLVALLSMALASFISGVGSVMQSTGVSEGWIEHLLANSGWRFLMISGALPAILIFFIRLFVPESKKWQQEHARGATSHWANRDLIGVLIGCAASLAIIWSWMPGGPQAAVAIVITFVGLSIALLGYLWPVRGYLARATATGSLRSASERQILGRMLLGAALSGVALLGTWGSTQWAPRWVTAELLTSDVLKQQYPFGKEWTQIWSSIGAIVGTMIAAICAGRFGRKITFAVLCIGSLISTLYLYQGHNQYDAQFLAAVFCMGALTASFYGFFPLYLPELFPTAVRATGQGFSYNFGRIIAAIGGLQTANLMASFGGSFAKAGSVVAMIYVIGIVIIWLGPETKGKPLPE